MQQNNQRSISMIHTSTPWEHSLLRAEQGAGVLSQPYKWHWDTTSFDNYCLDGSAGSAGLALQVGLQTSSTSFSWQLSGKTESHSPWLGSCIFTRDPWVHVCQLNLKHADLSKTFIASSIPTCFMGWGLGEAEINRERTDHGWSQVRRWPLRVTWQYFQNLVGPKQISSVNFHGSLD